MSPRSRSQEPVSVEGAFARRALTGDPGHPVAMSGHQGRRDDRARPTAARDEDPRAVPGIVDQPGGQAAPVVLVGACSSVPVKTDQATLDGLGQRCGRDGRRSRWEERRRGHDPPSAARTSSWPYGSASRPVAIRWLPPDRPGDSANGEGRRRPIDRRARSSAPPPVRPASAVTTPSTVTVEPTAWPRIVAIGRSSARESTSAWGSTSAWASACRSDSDEPWRLRPVSDRRSVSVSVSVAVACRASRPGWRSIVGRTRRRRGCGRVGVGAVVAGGLGDGVGAAMTRKLARVGHEDSDTPRTRPRQIALPDRAGIDQVAPGAARARFPRAAGATIARIRPTAVVDGQTGARRPDSRRRLGDRPGDGWPGGPSIGARTRPPRRRRERLPDRAATVPRSTGVIASATTKGPLGIPLVDGTGLGPGRRRRDGKPLRSQNRIEADRDGLPGRVLDEARPNPDSGVPMPDGDNALDGDQACPFGRVRSRRDRPDRRRGVQASGVGLGASVSEWASSLASGSASASGRGSGVGFGRRRRRAWAPALGVGPRLRRNSAWASGSGLSVGLGVGVARSGAATAGAHGGGSEWPRRGAGAPGLGPGTVDYARFWASGAPRRRRPVRRRCRSCRDHITRRRHQAVARGSNPAGGAGATEPSTKAFVASPQPIASIALPPIGRTASAPPVAAKPPLYVASAAAAKIPLALATSRC